MASLPPVQLPPQAETVPARLGPAARASDHADSAATPLPDGFGQALESATPKAPASAPALALDGDAPVAPAAARASATMRVDGSGARVPSGSPARLRGMARSDAATSADGATQATPALCTSDSAGLLALLLTAADPGASATPPGAPTGAAPPHARVAADVAPLPARDPALPDAGTPATPNAPPPIAAPSEPPPPSATPVKPAARPAGSAEAADSRDERTGPRPDPASVVAGDRTVVAEHPAAPVPAVPSGRPASPQPDYTPATQVAAALPPLVATAAAHPGGGQRVTVALHPADLGAVEIRVARAPGGTVHVALAAERAETLAALRSDPAAIEAALDRAGLPAHGRSVSFALLAPAPAQAPPLAHPHASDAVRPVAATYDPAASGNDDRPRGDSGGAQTAGYDHPGRRAPGDAAEWGRAPAAGRFASAPDGPPEPLGASLARLSRLRPNRAVDLTA